MKERAGRRGRKSSFFLEGAAVSGIVEEEKRRPARTALPLPSARMTPLLTLLLAAVPAEAPTARPVDYVRDVKPT